MCIYNFMKSNRIHIWNCFHRDWKYNIVHKCFEINNEHIRVNANVLDFVILVFKNLFLNHYQIRKSKKVRKDDVKIASINNSRLDEIGFVPTFNRGLIVIINGFVIIHIAILLNLDSRDFSFWLYFQTNKYFYLVEMVELLKDNDL